MGAPWEPPEPGELGGREQEGWVLNQLSSRWLKGPIRGCWGRPSLLTDFISHFWAFKSTSLLLLMCPCSPREYILCMTLAGCIPVRKLLQGSCLPLLLGWEDETLWNGASELLPPWGLEKRPTLVGTWRGCLKF